MLKISVFLSFPINLAILLIIYFVSLRNLMQHRILPLSTIAQNGTHLIVYSGKIKGLLLASLSKLSWESKGVNCVECKSLEALIMPLQCTCIMFSGLIL